MKPTSMTTCCWTLQANAPSPGRASSVANWLTGHDASVCRSCFWAYPEEYTHIAGEQVRRIDIEWRGDEVAIFDRLRVRAEREDTTVAELLKRVATRLA